MRILIFIVPAFVLCYLLVGCRKKKNESEEPEQQTWGQAVVTTTATAFHGFFERSNSIVYSSGIFTNNRNVNVRLYEDGAIDTRGIGFNIGSVFLNDAPVVFVQDFLGRGHYESKQDENLQTEQWKLDDKDDLLDFQFNSTATWPGISNMIAIPDSLSLLKETNFNLHLEGITSGNLNFENADGLLTYSNSLQNGDNLIRYDSLWLLGMSLNQDTARINIQLENVVKAAYAGKDFLFRKKVTVSKLVKLY